MNYCKYGLLIVLIAGSQLSCSHYKKNASHRNVTDASIKEGENLAKQYCQSCHLLPDPYLANSDSWSKGILPNMGPRLGIFHYGWENYPSYANDPNMPAGFYPSNPLLSSKQWQNIIDYYTALAPDSLASAHRMLNIEMKEDLFNVKSLSYAGITPSTCYVKIDTSNQPGSLLVADIFSRQVRRYDQDLHLIDSVKVPSPVVDIFIKDDEWVTTHIGELNPTNGRYGCLRKYIKDLHGLMKQDRSFHIDSLQRPVQSIQADLNGDGLEDYLICEFGHITGSLSWYENKGNQTFVRHVLRPVPGAIKAYLCDYNRDGLPDILVLFAQGDEGIFLFTNLGKGRFEQKELIRFPPSFGSSYFELDDFNGDGFPDILYTCGDNADFSPVLKPYHGLYIFINDGNYHFKQQYFFPMNGCYKAIARDFDGDGKIDIAAIAFFADFDRQPQEGFVFLKNLGGMQFQPFSLKEAESGRWLTMDAGKLKANGKTDLILGNFSIAPSIKKPKTDWKKAAPFLVLENQMQ